MSKHLTRRKKLHPQLPALGVSNLKKYFCGVELDFDCGLIPLQAVVSASVKEPPPHRMPFNNPQNKRNEKTVVLKFKNSILAFELASKFMNTRSEVLGLKTTGYGFIVLKTRHRDGAIVLLQPQHP